jgi:hypothetical protein
MVVVPTRKPTKLLDPMEAQVAVVAQLGTQVLGVSVWAVKGMPAQYQHEAVCLRPVVEVVQAAREQMALQQLPAMVVLGSHLQ